MVVIIAYIKMLNAQIHEGSYNVHLNNYYESWLQLISEGVVQNDF